MATWTLILVFWGGGGMATSTVGGFSSLVACNAALEQVRMDDRARGILSSAVCVEVK